MTYMTFPLIKDNRLLIKILNELYSSLVNMINAVLQYEYIYKRINLYKDAKENFRAFFEISGRYSINEEHKKKILEIFSLIDSHKKSPFEFVKNEKVVMMSDNSKITTISLEKIKELLLNTKDVSRKINSALREKSKI